MTLPSLGSGSPAASASLCAVVNPSPSGPELPLQTYDTVRVSPTERPEAGVPRLTTALRAALAATVPTNLTVTGTIPECDQPQFTYQPPYREYTTIATLTRDGQRSHLEVGVRPTSVEARTDCAGTPDGRDCEVRALGEDGVATLSTSRDPAGGILRMVQLQRSDGTSVTVRVGNLLYGDGDGDGDGDDSPPESAAPEALLTSQELVELARAPGLTLYP
ncbi:hypothetical protein GCM10027614_46980 [Micromonospora vulcania]